MKIIGLVFSLILHFSYTYAQPFSLPELPESDFYAIGEESHGIESTLNFKLEIVSNLRRRFPNLDVFVEAPLVHSIVNFLEQKPVSYLYPHTGIRPVSDSLSRWGSYGFDMQEDCRYLCFSNYLRGKGYVKAIILEEQDRILDRVIGEKALKSQLTQEEGTKLAYLLDQIDYSILELCEDTLERSLLHLCVESRRYLNTYLMLDVSRTMLERIRARDSMMALNIQGLYKTLRPQRTIIWAANLHISEEGGMGRWSKRGVRSMGEILVELFPTMQYYSLAIVEKKKLKKIARKGYYDLVISDPIWTLIAPEQWQYNCP
jgi:hypothetical protein